MPCYNSKCIFFFFTVYVDMVSIDVECKNAEKKVPLVYVVVLLFQLGRCIVFLSLSSDYAYL